MWNPHAASLRVTSQILFPIIHQAAHRVHFNRPQATPSVFARALVRELRDLGTHSELLPDGEDLLLIDKAFWLQVIGPETDLEQMSRKLRQDMHEQHEVLVGYLLKLGSSLRWGRVQISEKWLAPGQQGDDSTSTDEAA